MVASFVHEALFYRSPDDYLALTVPFIQRARTAREPVLVAVPRPKIDLLAGALGGVADGVRFLDMTRAGRNPGKIIPWLLHAFLEEHAGQPVRIIGEPVWAGRSAEEYPACVQHEALINVAFAGHGVSILCPYDSAALYAGRAGLSRHRVADLQLAVNELASNAITHGGGTGRLRLWPAGRQVICEVRDGGQAVGRLTGRVPP